MIPVYLYSAKEKNSKVVGLPWAVFCMEVNGAYHGLHFRSTRDVFQVASQWKDLDMKQYDIKTSSR